MQELPLLGHTYQIGKMPAMAALHCARRVAPAWSAFGMGMHEMAQKMKAAQQVPDFDAEFLRVAQPVAEIVARMSDADVNYVVQACLNLVRRKQAEGWAPVMRGENLMFEDMPLNVMMRLVFETLKENVGGFFQAPTAATESQASA